jgi:hypothetical protein
MDEHTPEEGFDSLGWYSPGDAERLLEVLQGSGIEYRTEVVGGPINILVGADRGIVISVRSAQSEQAHRAHAGLFGDGLPNFDSAYFREHPPEAQNDDEKA